MHVDTFQQCSPRCLEMVCGLLFIFVFLSVISLDQRLISLGIYDIVHVKRTLGAENICLIEIKMSLISNSWIFKQ